MPLEQNFKAYLAACGKVALLVWIEENVRFPCSVVDRITPKSLAKDADPYEEAKIGILIGGHTCLVYLAALSGLKTYDEAMRAPKLLAHFNAYETMEVLPSIADGLPFSATN